jgi:hypothetical protein
MVATCDDCWRFGGIVLSNYLRWRASFAICLICLLPIMLQWPVLVGWLDADPMLFVAGVGEPAKLPGGMPWIDPNVGYQAHALGKLSADMLLHGQLPWWNPYNGVGLPLAAEAQPASLFLPFVLLYHFREGFIWVEVLLQILAGVCTYAFLRKMRLTELAAVTGGVLYEFNGTFAWHGAPIIGPIAFLPMLLLGVEQLFHRMREGRSGGWWLIPLALAWSIYAGFPETAYINGLFVGLWVLFRLPDLERRVRLPFLGKLAFSVCIGLACSLPQIVPFAEYLTNAYVGGHAGYFAHISIPWATTALTLVPGLFGPIFRFNDPLNLIHASWGDIGGYFPALQLALLLLAVQLRPRRLVWASAAWIVFCLAKTYDIRPLSDLVNLLPLIKSAALYRYSAPSWQFAGIFVVCVGIDAIQRGAVPGYRHAFVAFVATFCAVLVAFWLACEPIVALRVDVVSARFVYIAVAWSLVTWLGGLVLMLPVGRRALCVRWLVALLLVDAIVAFALPMQSGARQVRHEHPGVDFLRAHVGLQRTYTLGPMAPNYGAYFKVAQINHNYLPVSSTWIQYVREKLDPAAEEVTFTGGINRARGYGTGADQLRLRLAAYEETGVKYVLAEPGVNPFASVLAMPSDPSVYHAARALDGQGAVLHWRIPPQEQARSISEISVLVGTYVGLSDGLLNVRICRDDGSCTQGARSLGESVDNMPFAIRLDHPLPIRSAGESLTLRFTQTQSSQPVALWISGVEADHAGEAVLEGSPKDTAPSISLIFSDVEAGLTHTKVYDGRDMSIYELSSSRPYFEIIQGECTIGVSSREKVQAQCSSAAVLLRREAMYPGWSVSVDGQPASLTPAHDIFQSVKLAPGMHEVAFSYRPTHWAWILGGFASGLLVLIVGVANELTAWVRTSLRLAGNSGAR